MLDIDNANRGTEMSLIGKLICAWKGKHAWRRVMVDDSHPLVKSLSADAVAISRCARCATERPIKPRTRKAKVAIAEGGGNE